MFTDTVFINDVEMSYFSFGKGERAFVILPGLDVKSVLLAAKAVENAYKIFSDRYTVYVFDRRRNAPEGYTVRDMADDTAKVMKHISISSACVFGASQGGMIGMCLAAKYPELVRAMVLGSTAAYIDEKSGRGIAKWIKLAQSRDMSALTLNFIENLFSEETLGKYKELLMHSNDSVTEEDICRFIILAKAIIGLDIREELSMISCPILVIGSRGDKLIPCELSEELAQGENRELYLYGEEYGHCVFDEAPDFKERMLDFFERVG